MWPFSKKATAEAIRGHKKICVNGMNFVIRKLNPIVDFPNGKIPQIFTSFISRRPAKENPPPPTEDSIKKVQEDMYDVIRMGVIDPAIEPETAKEGLKASDLFRDPTMGPQLYIEILAHSLNAFRGLRGLFFFHKIRHLLLTQWRKGMEAHRRKLRSPMAGSV